MDLLKFGSAMFHYTDQVEMPIQIPKWARGLPLDSDLENTAFEELQGCGSFLWTKSMKMKPVPN